VEITARNSIANFDAMKVAFQFGALPESARTTANHDSAARTMAQTSRIWSQKIFVWFITRSVSCAPPGGCKSEQESIEGPDMLA
jgi:hypothetical protein